MNKHNDNAKFLNMLIAEIPFSSVKIIDLVEQQRALKCVQKVLM